jgi:hypothetical protein
MSPRATRKLDSAPLGGSFGASAAENSLVKWKTTFCTRDTIRPLCTVSRTHILLCPAPVSAGHGGGPVWAATGSSPPTSKAAQIPQGQPPKNWNLRLKIYSPNWANPTKRFAAFNCASAAGRGKPMTAGTWTSGICALPNSIQLYTRRHNSPRLCELAGSITPHRRIPCQRQPRQWSRRFLVIHNLFYHRKVKSRSLVLLFGNTMTYFTGRFGDVI